ncbi:MAG: hypothetical protein U0804_16585 [Gemmataceae bacterium]
MTTFYTLGARLSGMAAVVCAVLALLASPAITQADEITDCQANCSGLPYPQVMECMTNCTNFDSQCPGKKDAKGNFTGCVSAGGACMYGSKASTCGIAGGGKACTCLPV